MGTLDSIFLKGVIETEKNIIQLFVEDRQKIENLGRPAAYPLLVHHYLKNIRHQY
ncbi:hypothetical protein [Coxiella endosymbiont of Ornithodoros amblus]|uniref:hypothetical protein n=1 Tax=Coxiella endosymbiont of Ornithodoros amblus TaxID=1656166 RepID=UPI00244E23A6|nr:hypothetical protein [Coxiella endosymbiont of Ornithodoros amblus]